MAGIDDTIGLWCEGDFAPDMRVISGRRKLIQRLMIRLQTQRENLGLAQFWNRSGAIPQLEGSPEHHRLCG
jgi:hypothetical protein